MEVEQDALLTWTFGPVPYMLRRSGKMSNPAKMTLNRPKKMQVTQNQYKPAPNVCKKAKGSPKLPGLVVS